MLDDIRIHVKLKLSALWASVVLCYLYGDFFALYRPGALQGMLAGNIAPYTVFVLATMPGAWAFYLFVGTVDMVLTALIVWYAWTWPRQAAA